jgi:hypothetical protein
MATANNHLVLVEVGVTNTTVTDFECSLRRVSAAGTPGASQTIVYEDGDSAGATAGDPRGLWTVTPTFVAGEVRRATIGASKGSGAVWTFGARGLLVPLGTANGVVLLPVDGTGQIFDVWWSWDI